MTNETEERKIRAYAIISKGEKISEAEDDCYLIPSQSGNRKYKVSVSHAEWNCTCLDFRDRQQDCKHIFAVRFWISVREKLKEETFDSKMENFAEVCVYCYSDKIVKDGNRITSGVKKQKYLCRDCGRRFVNDVIARTKGNGKIITLVMDLWFKGVSMRKIKDHISQFYDIQIGKSTIQRWISKFVEELNKKTEGMNPRLLDTLHVDEQIIKSKGKNVYCWNAMDKDTRFLMASNVTFGRKKKDARKLMMKMRNNRVHPRQIVTDQLGSYSPAIVKVFGNSTMHIRNPSIRNVHSSNNVIERYHNTFRERDKIIRGFKSNKTAQNLIDGYRLYYNFIRIHQGLGMTPAEKAGLIALDGNRWIGLLSMNNKYS